MKNKRYGVPALATIATLSGCSYHVAVDPPPAHANPQERVAAYQRLRPQAEVEHLHVIVDKYGTTVSPSASIVLADGTSVSEADDLLPVLDSATPAARAARRSAAAGHTGLMWFTGGMVVAAVGLTLATGDLVSSANGDGNSSSHTLSLVGLGATLVGLLAGYAGHMYYGQVEQRERHAAFATYDASLQQSLHICIVGLQVTDCEAPPSPPSQVQAAVAQ